MNLPRFELLTAVLSQPSAPFREGHVIRAITAALDAGKVPWFQDPVGNIVVGAASPAEYRALVRGRDAEPVRVFIAHMDHPGFHGVSLARADLLDVKWHGGSPTACLENAPVWLADDHGWIGEGHLRSAKLLANGRAIDLAQVELPGQDHRPIEYPKRVFGGFRFRSTWWQEGDLIYTQAADDLVGAFCISSLALELFSKRSRKRPPFLGLLTRAEEVGFIGAIGHLELGWLSEARRQVICVSLETSRQLPGAEIGKGPVLRLGDRYSVFDAGALSVFARQAQRALPDRHQKRVMDGGTCEASAALAYGFRTVGISVPLGNYHNQGLEGGPDCAGPNGPAPEFVHLRDVEGLLAMGRCLLEPRLRWADPWAERRKEFRKWLRDYRPLLRAGPCG